MAEMNFKSILATIVLLIPYLYIRRYQTQKVSFPPKTLQRYAVFALFAPLH